MLYSKFTPSLWTAFQVILSGMQTLENYAATLDRLLHDTDATGCLLHAIHPMPQIDFYVTAKNSCRHNTHLQSLAKVRILEILFNQPQRSLLRGHFEFLKAD